MDLALDLDPERLRPRAPRLLRWAALALFALSAACATTRPPASGASPAATATPLAAEKPADIVFPPEEVEVTNLELELEGKNDEELFAIGMAADQAGDWPRAATAFARIADRFPGSRHEATAVFDAGLAYQKLREWRLALERFHAFVRGWEGPDALEASFKIAECHYHLEDLAAAHATLAALAARPGLPAAVRVRVLAQLGVIDLEGGKLEDAEQSLRRALAVWTSVGDQERLDPYYAAQAEHYLGEVFRARSLAIPLDPSKDGAARLGDALEDKCLLLLDAQRHYMRAIRFGDQEWAVASAARVGDLYDALRQQLLDAPLPPGLDEEQQQVYRELLRKRLRTLAAKAIDAYEAALGHATLKGIELKTLPDARQALQRLEDALREDAGKGL